VWCLVFVMMTACRPTVKECKFGGKTFVLSDGLDHRNW
jgi:hypothetical protein